MKSERRHELQTNYLADHLGTAVQSSKPYAVYVTAGLAALILLAIGYGIYASLSAKAASAAWGDYYFNIGSGNAEVFQQVAQDHAGTSAATWSTQAWADNQLLVGLDQLYTNRKTAEESIKSAMDGYQQVLKSAYDQDLKTRAALGLAQANEALGKLDDAARYYKQVVSGSQDGFASMAANRLAWISSADGKAFYEWFEKARTTTPPPQIPGNLSVPPSSPSMSFPQKVNPLTLPGSGETTTPAASDKPAESAPASTPSIPLELPSAPATPAPTTPAPETTPAPPATTPAPAAETPAGDKPAADKPAADKPAESAPAVPPPPK